MSLNIRSLKPKILSLRHDLSYFDCDLRVLSETWLKPETISRLVSFPGYSLTRADRPDGSGFGGVVVLTRTGLRVKTLQSVCSSNNCKLETLWLSVTTQHGRRFMCALYRPPCHSLAQVTTDVDCLETQIQRFILHSSCPIFISGDINAALTINLLASDSDHARTKLVELLDSLSLHQFVRVPTYR